MNRLDELVVVTGGIGSGKSAVAGLLRTLDWTVIDADDLARQALDAMVDAVAQRWPEAVTDSVIDRAVLAQLVFSDIWELENLERLVYPMVETELASWRRETKMPAAVEISSPNFKVTESVQLVVDAPIDLRRSRLVARGMDPEDLERRLRMQPSRAGWLERASVVLNNSGDSMWIDRVVRHFDHFWRAQ